MNESLISTPITEVHNSSLISGDGYDEATQTLAIRFRSNSSIYDYAGVSPDLNASYQAADSKGGFFTKNIKNVITGKKR